MDKPTITIEELLPMLRKHGVLEYSSDQFGVRVKFEPTPSPMTLKDAERLLVAEIEKALPPDATPRVEPAGPEMGHIEVVRHDLDEVLFGAK
jgi:hypothetical protein